MEVWVEVSALQQDSNLVSLDRAATSQFNPDSAFFCAFVRVDVLVCRHLHLLGFSLLQQLQYCVLSGYLSPNVPRKIRHLVAITIGICKMAEGDKYLDYPDKTLEWMAKL